MAATFRGPVAQVLEAAASGQVIGGDPVGHWGPHALAARRTATLDRFHAGYDAWMRWVDAFQHLREELVQRPGLLRSLSTICAADLHSLTFDTTFDATGFVWPTRVSSPKPRSARTPGSADASFTTSSTSRLRAFLAPPSSSAAGSSAMPIFLARSSVVRANFGSAHLIRKRGSAAPASPRMPGSVGRDSPIQRASLKLRSKERRALAPAPFADTLTFPRHRSRTMPGLRRAHSAVVRYSRARALRAIHGSSTTRSRALRTSTARTSPVEFASTMTR